MGEHKWKDGFLGSREVHQMTVDPKNAVQKSCECGCKYFQPVVMVYTVSAILSPNGKELTAQRPALICLECKKVLGEKNG